MSRVLRVSESDYRLQVQEGGRITLDVGNSPGQVIITGDLVVQGETTTVNTTEMTIEDRIITLNSGETGSGVITTGTTSGIEIDRGTLVTASFLFDDSKSWYAVGDGTYNDVTQGVWVSRGGETLSGTPAEINAIQSAGLISDYGNNRDITFDLRGTTKALRVINSSNYESYVTNDNHIPNRKWVENYSSSGGVEGGIADVNRIYKGPANPSLSPYNLYAEVVADGTTSINGTVSVRIGNTNDLFQFTANGLIFDNTAIKIHQDTITTVSDRIKISAQNKIIETDGYIYLDERPEVDLPNPLAVTNASETAIVFSSSVKGAGKTGIYFAHRRVKEDDTGTESVNDELIAKNRALLFSMLF